MKERSKGSSIVTLVFEVILTIILAIIFSFSVLSGLLFKELGDIRNCDQRNFWGEMDVEQNIYIYNTTEIGIYVKAIYENADENVGVIITISNDKDSISKFVKLNSLDKNQQQFLMIKDFRLLTMNGEVTIALQGVNFSENDANYLELELTKDTDTSVLRGNIRVDDELSDQYMIVRYNSFSYKLFAILSIVFFILGFIVIRNVVNNFFINGTAKCFGRDIRRFYKYMCFSAKADLTSEVTNAYLDWFWWILEPVCNMLIYYLIFGVIFHNEEKYYMVFIYSALTMWVFFSKTMTISVKLVKDTKGIITKVYIPKQVLLLSKMLVNGFKMLISCGITALLMFPYKIPVDYHLLGLIPVFLCFFIFTYGCGCILMHFGVYVEDLAYIVSIVLNMLFYFNGIFYSVGDAIPRPVGPMLEVANPLAFLIAQMRNALMYERGLSFDGMICWGTLSVVLALVGTKIIYKNENSYVKVI